MGSGWFRVARATAPGAGARPVGNGPEQFLGFYVISQVLAIRLGRMVTLSLCLSKNILVLHIIFIRREVRVWGTSWGRSWKKNLEQIWAYLFGILFNSFPIFVPNFNEETVCNILQQCRPLFFGGFPNALRKKKERKLIGSSPHA